MLRSAARDTVDPAGERDRIRSQRSEFLDCRAFLDCDPCKSTGKKTMTESTPNRRGHGVDEQDWAGVERSLDANGNGVLPGLLTAPQCKQLAALYPREVGYRSKVVMARHGFGRGEYKYFAYPLPPLLDNLRHALYPRLVPTANRWNQQLGIDVSYPGTLVAFLERCHRAQQTRPT